jgi:pimeloyl-ACP methyl ester carboxylesterase
MKKIYILHGWTYSTDKWKPMINLLEKHDISVKLLSIPGLTDGTDRIWTLDDYIDWLKEELKSEKKVTLLGHSNGGRISLAFSARYPEAVDRLILIDSAGIYPKGLYISVKRSIFWLIAKLGKKITRSEKVRRLLYRAAREGDYEKATPAMRKTMANLLAIDLRSVLKDIQARTLIIWGAKDGSTPLSDGELMHKEIKQSKLFVIPDAKHSPQATHPSVVAERIIQELG